VRSNRLSFPIALIALSVLIAVSLACSISAMPTAQLQPIASPRPTDVPSSPVPTSSPTSRVATVTPVATSVPTATVKSRVELHSGPGNEYPTLGSLASGLPVHLTGRNADKSWWQIEFAPGPGGRAWLPASSVDLKPSSAADALPIVSAPPTPTRAAVAATATPGSSVFRTDRTLLNPGECTLLRWDVDDVSAVYVNLGQGELPVGGHDTTEICPDATTDYAPRVVGKDGTSQQYTLRVAVAPCGPRPVITHFEANALEVEPGASVVLAWDVACAKAVFFKEGTAQEPRQPVSGHDEIEVKPTKTTTYRLIVVAQDGSEIKQDLTVKVVP
jgi:uncharacterized protein YgiM (DUF1202 family)